MLAEILEQFVKQNSSFFPFFDLKNIGVKKLATIQIHFFYKLEISKVTS